MKKTVSVSGNCFEGLFDFYHFDWLAFYIVERCGFVFCPCKVNFVEVDTTDGAVMHCSVVNPSVGHVGCRGPLCCARNVDCSLSFRKFTTEKAGFQVMKDATDKTKLVLVIDRKPIADPYAVKERQGNETVIGLLY